MNYAMGYMAVSYVIITEKNGRIDSYIISIEIKEGDRRGDKYYRVQHTSIDLNGGTE